MCASVCKRTSCVWYTTSSPYQLLPQLMSYTFPLPSPPAAHLVPLSWSYTEVFSSSWAWYNVGALPSRWADSSHKRASTSYTLCSRFSTPALSASHCRHHSTRSALSRCMRVCVCVCVHKKIYVSLLVSSPDHSQIYQGEVGSLLCHGPEMVDLVSTNRVHITY